MSGQIKQFNKNKGYESIPRDFLQDNSISYEARGLLAELQSYPENWKIYKTELYRRCEKDKRFVIERIWKELEQAGYLIQFRRRAGKKYEYEYIFCLEKFTEEDLAKISQELSTDQYEPYFSNHSPKPCSDKVSSSVKKQHPKKGEEKSWDANNQQSQISSCKLATKKLTTNKCTTKERDDDPLKGTETALSPFCQLLVDSNRFNAEQALEVAGRLEGHKVDLGMVTEQLAYMATIEIHDSVTYFVNGILQKCQEAELGKTSIIYTVSTYNWLRECSE